ncbi:Glu/Leu/Phe/Val dehydrogenase dimerization domain-containing protein [Natronomonas sp.]|uniref:Glu/Leu/Phe/Val dehydrogenase dimerization domain-containing protein n=1 Tax=Natronomonas sp. TaxID=2184060 RepID=UPI003975606B
MVIDDMVNLQALLAEHGHNEFKAFRDDEVGLRGFIAIHDTTLGPAAGGTRRYAFESEEEAIVDALRLSRAMTYKYAISGINMGGGKAVIWVDDPDQRSEELYRAYGRMVDSFGGRFVTGADVGTNEEAMRWIGDETDYIIGLPEQFDHPDGYHGGGLGVIKAMEACCDLTYDDRELSDLHIVVQGVGEMGTSIVQYLHERGAQVTVSDINEAQVDYLESEYGVGSVDPDDVFDVDCDVFAPSALGFVLNDETIPRLQCDIVCGAANNQLDDEERHGTMLHEEDILYAPDYLANSGRTIDDTDLLRRGGYKHHRARAMIDGIYDRMMTIGQRAAETDEPTYAIANGIASQRIEAMRAMREKVHTTRKPQW